MRTFLLGKDEAVVLGDDDIVVRVLGIDGDEVWLGVECPVGTSVEEGEADALLAPRQSLD